MSYWTDDEHPFAGINVDLRKLEDIVALTCHVDYLIKDLKAIENSLSGRKLDSKLLITRKNRWELFDSKKGWEEADKEITEKVIALVNWILDQPLRDLPNTLKVLKDFGNGIDIDAEW